MKYQKSILGALLAIIMLFAAMPMSAAAEEAYAVSYDLTHLTSDNVTQTPIGDDCVINLTADEGYRVPDSITVTIGGEIIEEGYLYSPGHTKNTAIIVVIGEHLTGDVVITATAVKKYDIVFVGMNYSIRLPVDDGQSINSQYNDPQVKREHEGYRFEGWFESTDDGETLAETPFDFNTVPTSDMTLYGKWTLIEEETTTVIEVTTTTTPPVITTETTAPAISSPQTGNHTIVTVSVTLIIIGIIGIMSVMSRKQHER